MKNSSSKREAFLNGGEYVGGFQIVMKEGKTLPRSITKRKGVCFADGVLTVVNGRIKKLNSLFEFFTGMRKTLKPCDLEIEYVVEVRHLKSKKLWKIG